MYDPFCRYGRHLEDTRTESLPMFTQPQLAPETSRNTFNLVTCVQCKFFIWQWNMRKYVKIWSNKYCHLPKYDSYEHMSWVTPQRIRTHETRWHWLNMKLLRSELHRLPQLATMLNQKFSFSASIIHDIYFWSSAHNWTIRQTRIKQKPLVHI